MPDCRKRPLPRRCPQHLQRPRNSAVILDGQYLGPKIHHALRCADANGADDHLHHASGNRQHRGDPLGSCGNDLCIPVCVLVDVAGESLAASVQSLNCLRSVSWESQCRLLCVQDMEQRLHHWSTATSAELSQPLENDSCASSQSLQGVRIEPSFRGPH